MITSFLVSFAGTFASEIDIWGQWNDILSDTFGDNTWMDDTMGGDDFTDFIWDQLDFGGATDAASSSLFEGWLTGIDLDDFISQSDSQLQDMLTSLGDTSGMTTEEIVEQLENAGFNPADYGWDANADLEDVLNEMSGMATDLEVMAWMEGWDLDEFPALEDLESTLQDFGFENLYGLEDINNYLETDVGDIIPDDYTAYQSQLDEITAGLSQIINGDSNAPDMDSVLSDLQSMIDSMETDVTNGATDLQEPLDNLENVYDVLSYFDEEPTDMLAQMAEDMASLFENTDYDYSGLDDTLGSDWLSQFETAMQELSGTTSYEVCADGFVASTISAEYPNLAAYGASCYQLILGNLDCTCLNNAGIYGNTDKEDVQESLMCLLDEDDDLTVEQTLRECNGEDVEMWTTLDAFEILDELTSQLTLDNFVDMDDDLVDTDALSATWEDIISGIEDLSSSDINTTGSVEDYRDSVSDWIENLGSLVDDLDVNGSYTDQGQQINDMLDDALSALDDDMESMESDDDGTGMGSSIKEDSIEWWVWVLVAVAACLLLCVICGFTVYQKNKKLSRLAIGIESETYAQVEGDAPLVPAGNVGSTTAGRDGEM